MSENVGLAVKKPDRKGKESTLAKSKVGISPSVDINSPVEQILHLQRTIGNQAVSRLIRSGVIHAKLSIGQPGDIYEQEADRVADRVMRMTEPQGALVNSHLSLVQRAAAPEEEEEKPISRKESGSCGGADVMSCVESHINALKGGGQSLSPSTRSFFEPRFGSDFSHVRVHTGSDAAAIATEINAKAFTTGRDIFFGAGQYSPGTSGGKSLLAHELTHVVQQSNSSVFAQRSEVTKGAKTQDCSDLEIFTELNPGAVLPSAYFQNGSPCEKGEFYSKLKASQKSKCLTEAKFKDIKLKWMLGNKELKTWWGVDINDGDKTFDIDNKLLYKRNAGCCKCFNGTLSWSINVNASRIFDKGTKRERTERGKTSTPLTGAKTISGCSGAICCSVDKTFPLSLWLGDEEVSIDFKGSATISGNIHEKED